jgi:hypothetical protein
MNHDNGTEPESAPVLLIAGSPRALGYCAPPLFALPLARLGRTGNRMQQQHCDPGIEAERRRQAALPHDQ